MQERAPTDSPAGDAGPASRAARRPFPERVGRYDLLEPIASGGMATVYLGLDRASDPPCEVAVKLTHAHLRESAEFVTELVEEGKLASRIRHPNVVGMRGAGEDAGEVFLVMDYVEGDTLWTLQRRSTAAGLPLAIGLRVLFDALAGLHAAHELTDASGASLRLVHRDFSPQNILVGVDGVSRLGDFGVAKAASRLGTTRTGFVKGKVAYMAPEQARGLPLDRRCDVWAAGVVAWEILAARLLYAHEAEAVMLLKLVTEAPPLLGHVCSDVPPEVEAAVARALTIERGDRCPDAATFARELGAACEHAGMRVATPAEVAEHVLALVGVKLTERRERARELAIIRGVASAAAARDAEHATRLAVERRVEAPPSAAEQAVGARAGARRIGAAAAAVALAGLALALSGALRGREPGQARAAASARPPIEPAAPAAEAAGAPILERPTPGPPPEATSAGEGHQLEIRGSEPIAELWIGDRAVALAEPRRELRVALSADEAASALRLKAISADGRGVEISAASARDPVSLRFPPRHARTRTGKGQGGPPRLAPSPYER